METRKEPLKLSQKFDRQISRFLKMTQFDVARPRLFLIYKLKIISDNFCCPHSSHSACSKAFLWSSSGGHSRHCLLNWWLIHRHALLTRCRGGAESGVTRPGGEGRPYQPIFTHITLGYPWWYRSPNRGENQPSLPIFARPAGQIIQY